MSLKVSAPITPVKPSRKRASDAAIVTPQDAKKSKSGKETPVNEGKWKQAMRVSASASERKMVLVSRGFVP